MLKSALCSITFRKLSPEEIIRLCVKANIHGIEWGGDIHVPHGDIKTAREVGELTVQAGLEVSTYGSYYRCEEKKIPFKDVLATAKALNTPTIRIWAGPKGSVDASEEDRKSVATAIRSAVDLATAEEVAVALEYHGGTLTDTLESTHRLLEEVDRSHLKLFWQPRTGGTFAGDLPELAAALPHLSNVHCFHWGPEGGSDRKPLIEGATQWKKFLGQIEAYGGDRFVTLEFVKNDSPDQFLEDAKTLNSILHDLGEIDRE